MNVTLHPAEYADAGRIAEILLEARAAFLPYAPFAHTDDQVRGWVHDTLLPSEDVTIGSVDSRVVGVMALDHADGISWISQLYLDPAYVGRGIGSRLLAVTGVGGAPCPPIYLSTEQRRAKVL
jgi:GNAT superfamily N-acetyltransferase